MSDYPEHKKLTAVHERSQAIGEFLDWCVSEKGYQLAEWDDSREIDHRMMPIIVPVEKLLAEFFGIDLQKLEAEKRAMLEEMRRLHDDEA